MGGEEDSRPHTLKLFIRGIPALSGEVPKMYVAVNYHFLLRCGANEAPAVRIIRLENTWRVMELADGREYCLELLALEHGYSVADVSVALGCSQRYLHVTFIRDIGFSPKRCMRYERMVLARRKLEGGLLPEEVAEQLGFAGLHSFRREFQEFYQISPGQFQRTRKIFDPPAADEGE